MIDRDRLVMWAIVEQLERISAALYALIPDCEAENLQENWEAISEKFKLHRELVAGSDEDALKRGDT